MVVAIDGPAGVGKSSLAKRIAAELGFFYLNSGAFYRGVAVKVIDLGIHESEEARVIEIAQSAHFSIRNDHLHLDGVDVTKRLRTDQVDYLSSVISAIIPVRHAVNCHLRRMAQDTDLVAEGRDMTTVVFPDATVKLYLDADVKTRAQRRLQQGTSNMNLEAIEHALAERDDRDRSKKEGALGIAPHAIVVDTSILTLDAVYEKVRKLINTYL